MARVYDLVARHFIASVSHDAVWRSTTVQLSIDELDDKGKFTIRGKQVCCVVCNCLSQHLISLNPCLTLLFPACHSRLPCHNAAQAVR